MARYVKSACDAFTGEIMANIDGAKQRLERMYDELEFFGAREKQMLDAYYGELIAGLDAYRARVGSYTFLYS